MCREPLRKPKRVFFKATTGAICYSFRSLQNVVIYDADQGKGGERKERGRVSHVLVAQKGLKKFHLNNPHKKVEGFGEVYEYVRNDGSKDFSFKIKSVRLSQAC